jgi:hypothetical protein
LLIGDRWLAQTNQQSEINNQQFPPPRYLPQSSIGDVVLGELLLGLGALGIVATLLTVLGTYVLAESMAVLRMREMSIRAALGTTRRQLGAIVLAETGRLIALGLAAGLVLVWMGAGLIRAFLFRLSRSIRRRWLPYPRRY